MFSHQLTDFSSEAHGCVVDMPQLTGCRFDELHAFFPCACSWGPSFAWQSSSLHPYCHPWRADSLVVGLLEPRTGRVMLNPPPSAVLMHGQQLLMLRPGSHM